MRACHVGRQHPALSYSLSRGSLERQSTFGGHRDGPSRVSTLVFVGERPVPHLLAALFTTAPRARLLKLCAGRTVLLALARHPHTRFLLLFCTPTPASCSLLSRTSFVHAFLLSQNVSLSLQNILLSLFPHSQNVSPHRTSLLTERLFITSGRLCGSNPPHAHPAPLAHGYHDDPCALKNGGHRSSWKIAAEEI